MRKLISMAALGVATSLVMTPALARDIRGHIALGGGIFSTDSTDDGSGDYGFGAAELSFGHGFASGWSYDIEGLFETYDYNGAEDPSEQPAYLGIVAGHVNRAFSNGARLGVFGGYGISWLNEDDDYAMWMAGLEAQGMGGNTRWFGQAGYGDNIESDGEEEGFQEGWFARAGVNQFFGDNTFFGVEGTLAGSSPYIDGNDDGEFYGVTARFQTRIPSTDINAQLYYSYNHYDATTEDDTLKESIFGLRFSYLFQNRTAREAAQGGGSLGVPLVPFRADGWAEQID